jgi:hypothetical protein
MMALSLGVKQIRAKEKIAWSKEGRMAGFEPAFLIPLPTRKYGEIALREAIKRSVLLLPAS